MRVRGSWGAVLVLANLLAAVGCTGRGNAPPATGSAPPPAGAGSQGCTGGCAGPESRLTTGEVERVLAQAAAEARARSAPAVIAVVDRVGNVLAVYRMSGAPATVRVGSGRGLRGGLEDLIVPAELAAIAKAITGAFLSSEGNAFSTRTASQIVQEHFNPGESGQPGGPLFGVQFSQLPCSDVNTRAPLPALGPGPHRSPLGLSADPGGFPLYKGGTPVGGIGVAADGRYGLDPDLGDRDRDLDELIALAGSFGFAAPPERRADRITVEGKTLRFSDAEFADLGSDPAQAAALATVAGSLVAVPGYAPAAIRAGTAFGTAASGIRPDRLDYPGLDAFVLVDGGDRERFRPQAAADGPGALSQAEVRTLMQRALGLANRMRAQIRQPLGSQARVSIAITDREGRILALARTRDAPVFGLDVAVQKARAAAFYSSPGAAATLAALARTSYLSLRLEPGRAVLSVVEEREPQAVVGALRGFLGRPTALADGAIAFSARAIGNLARPFYPDGIRGTAPGPFSRPFEAWSPFHVGTQLDLVYPAVALHLAHLLNQSGLAIELGGSVIAPAPSPGNPVPLPDPPPGSCVATPRLANGHQIFPGAVPIYRGTTLVGAIGVSGDGIDQDDLVAFLAVHETGEALGGGLGNAPRELRADQLAPQGVRLRYVQCPTAPFLDSTAQNVCEGL
ncbi:MAG: heme-binding protein [Xanthomonadales bacterium]|nr:heme-binding protein [Xanthomonadales bacterium]